MENTTPSTDTTYDVLAYRFEDLEKKVEKFARKANSLGLPPVSIEVVGEKLIPVLDERTGLPTGRVRVYKVVKVHGEAPVVAGHTFVARVEHTEAGNIISKAPGLEGVVVPASMRDGEAYCDHCRTHRRRNDTFVLREDTTGSLLRVGRNCLADYLRTADAAEALRLWAFLSDLSTFGRDSDEEGGGGCREGDPSTLHFVACTIRSIELSGWVSRKVAYENDAQSTASEAAWASGPCPRDSKATIEWTKAQPSEENAKEAAAAIEWAKALEGNSDYEHNLKVGCSLGYVRGKNTGLVASVVVAYRRFREQELAKEREASKKGSSGHVGVEGHKYSFQLTVTHVSSWDSAYGVTVLYVLEDASGNVFKWFSSGGCDHPVQERKLEAGDCCYFTFTVKGHGEYKGRKETTVTRASASEAMPSHKWFNPATGEVFKSKKEMAAAA